MTLCVYHLHTQAVLSVRYQVALRIVSDHPELLLQPEGHAAARAAGLGAFMGHKSTQVSSHLSAWCRCLFY